MSRTRRRTTNRRRQDERQLSLRTVRRATPDAKKLSRAFINLALARAQAEADAKAAACDESPQPDDRVDAGNEEASDAAR